MYDFILDSLSDYQIVFSVLVPQNIATTADSIQAKFRPVAASLPM